MSDFFEVGNNIQVFPTGATRSALDVQIGGEHYKNMEVQPIEFCQRNRLTFCESNVIKYVCRHRSKGGKKDIEKAIHNLQVLIDLEYGVQDV